MTTKLLGGVGAAIGSQYLPKRNQLVFVEYSKGAISLLDLIRASAPMSSGTVVLKGTWIFDCETGTLGGNLNGPGDIWWEQIDNVKRQMTPVGGACVVNLGKVNFAALTPQALQALTYNNTPIIGNNDPSNQLVNNDVFAVLTKEGNVAKIQVVQYGYDMTIQYVTYKLVSPYHVIGTGYMTPEDIAVASDEKTAYVTERTGNLLKVNLNNANRPAATVIATGFTAPQQIYLDEVNNQVYLVEYSNPGKLVRVNLSNNQKTTLINGLNNAVGLLISSNLAYAYISEQSLGGRITRYSLQGGSPTTIATGLTNPFFLSWLDPGHSTIITTERDPANKVTLVDVTNINNIRRLPDKVGARPSSVSPIDTQRVIVCCDQEIDLCNILGNITVSGLFKGIGFVPWNLITLAGRADTTTQPTYPYQFAKDVPFAGSLSLQINQLLSWQSGVSYYRVIVDGSPRLDTWSDLKLNIVNGKYEIPVPFTPTTINNQPGYFAIHQPGDFYMNTDLGMILDSTNLGNGTHDLKVDFTDNNGTILQSKSIKVDIDNNNCVAHIDPPVVNNLPADQCGMLKYANKTNPINITYVASHPTKMADYSLSIVRAYTGVYSTYGQASLVPFTYSSTVGTLLGNCPTAAFAATLYVAARAINGFSRQSQYDASQTMAFALTQ